MPIDTVYLEDENWDKINVEAVIGNDANPDNNRSLGIQTLTRPDKPTWKIESNGEDIYYRRDADPDHPDGRMTVWTHRPCYGDGSVYHERVA